MSDTIKLEFRLIDKTLYVSVDSLMLEFNESDNILETLKEFSHSVQCKIDGIPSASDVVVKRG